MQAAEEGARQERREREEREAAARKRLAASGEEADKRRRQAAHSSAAQGYGTLLQEVVKDPEARWQDWKPRLERDPQVSAGLQQWGEFGELYSSSFRQLALQALCIMMLVAG